MTIFSMFYFFSFLYTFEIFFSFFHERAHTRSKNRPGQYKCTAEGLSFSCGLDVLSSVIFLMYENTYILSQLCLFDAFDLLQRHFWNKGEFFSGAFGAGKYAYILILSLFIAFLSDNFRKIAEIF